MPWYYILMSGLALWLALTVTAMLLPLRIFVLYVRENKKDRIKLELVLFRLGLRILVNRNGPEKAALWVMMGSRTLPLPVTVRKAPGAALPVWRCMGRQFSWPAGEPGRAGKGSDPFKILAAFKAVRPQLKKVSWRRFHLELTFGLGDPALTGMAAGGVRLAGGIFTGLLYRLFSVDTAPRIEIVPQFDGTGIRLRWESELSVRLFRALYMLTIARKTGGAVNG